MLFYEGHQVLTATYTEKAELDFGFCNLIRTDNFVLFELLFNVSLPTVWKWSVTH